MSHLPECSPHDTRPPATCNPQLGGALACDAWHHYYHYQSSAQYLWLAETLRALGRLAEMRTAYEKAVFQDHFNEEALAGKENRQKTPPGTLPGYAKHPGTDAEFCASVGLASSPASAPHDEAAALFCVILSMDLSFAMPAKAGIQSERRLARYGHLDGLDASFRWHDKNRNPSHTADYSIHATTPASLRMTEIKTLLDRAIAIDPQHSNSFFTRGKYYFFRQAYAQARDDFAEAIRLSHAAHSRYHAEASAAHLARGKRFLGQGETDLAVSDFTKALDLDRNNSQARAARAGAYRVKGNDRLAEEDEAAMSS